MRIVKLPPLIKAIEIVRKKKREQESTTSEQHADALHLLVIYASIYFSRAGKR